MAIYGYGQTNNNSILNPQAPTTQSGGGFGSFFGGIGSAIKSGWNALTNQATGSGAPQASPSTYNSFSTPQTSYNTPSAPVLPLANPTYHPTHSVSTTVKPDGTTTHSTAPVAMPSQTAPTNYGQQFTDTQGNQGTAQYDSATGKPLANVLDSTTQSGPAQFYTDLSQYGNTYPSSSLSGSTSYEDIMRKRDQLEQQYQQNYQNYLQKQVGFTNLQNQDKANETMAGMTGETTDYGQGAAGLAQRNDAMKELAASSALATAGVPVTALNSQLDYQNQNLGNYYNQQNNERANAPQFSGQTVNQSTGDIYGFVRDPITGKTSTQIMGNVYTGNYGGVQGGLSGGGFSGGATGGVPSLVSPYVAKSIGGQNYVNADRIPANQMDAIKIQAAQAGIPVLSTEEVAKVRAIDQTSQNLNNIQGTIQSILKPGILGRGLDAALNPIKDFLQTDPNISSFDSYRTAAINAIQALAGGSGSGFRLNQSEIDTATSNLPTITDNIETATAKLDKMRSYLSQWTGELFPNQQGTQSSIGSSGATGGMIQTKVGAINPNF